MALLLMGFLLLMVGMVVVAIIRGLTTGNFGDAVGTIYFVGSIGLFGYFTYNVGWQIGIGAVVGFSFVIWIVDLILCCQIFHKGDSTMYWKNRS
jgi:hypothetical protein